HPQPGGADLRGRHVPGPVHPDEEARTGSVVSGQWPVGSPEENRTGGRRPRGRGRPLRRFTDHLARTTGHHFSTIALGEMRVVNNVKINSLDWDIGGVPEAPSAPETLQQTGLSLGFLSDMMLRILYTRGSMLGLDVARLMCLPFKVCEEALGFLKHEKCIEVQGGDLTGPISYRFNLTELGRRRAQEAFKMCASVGPAPVPLEDYVEQTYRQAVTAIDISPEALRAAFSPLVVSEELFNAVGPAVVSGKSVFIYGPPGNGKTSIAQSIGNFMNTCGGGVSHPLPLP